MGINKNGNRPRCDRFLLCLSLLLSGLLNSCKLRSENQDLSKTLITQGVLESGFPYVVRIAITKNNSDGGWCTASFLSDSLAITAAHCMTQVRMIQYGEVKVTPENIFIHPNWIPGNDGTVSQEQIRYDLALIRFPTETYQGGEFARIAQFSPGVDTPVKIVGFGYYESKGFESYCYLPIKRLPDTQKCGLQLATWQNDGTYNVTTIFSFDPSSPNSTDPDVVECTAYDLNFQLSIQLFSSIEKMRSQKCGGHMGANKFTGRGDGQKRSGMNKVNAIENGAITILGSPSGNPTGENSAGAQGDSGGPLLIQEGDQWVVAGTTSSGRTFEENSKLIQRAKYKNINEADTLEWFRTIAQEKSLNFPQFNSKPPTP